MEETLMEDMLDLLKWLIKIRKTEKDKTTPDDYYEFAINSLENIIKVSNDLLKAYKELKI